MSQPTDQRPMQKAWVVPNIDEAARRWSAALGIGPFFVATYTPERFESLLYRGAPGVLTMTTAIAYAGDEQIELIQPLGDAPNAYRDTVPDGASGFHHLCFWSRDLDADIAHYSALGYPIANRGQMAGGPRFAYMDATAGIGSMIELLEWSAGLEAFFDGLRRQCAEWDGAEVIRRL